MGGSDRIRFLEHRIGDERVLRLIRKWLKAGVLDEGVVTEGEVGTPQGATVSPMLANVYLHYVLDLWAQQWRKRQATGDLIIVRYADDAVPGFEHEADARRFLEDLRYHVSVLWRRALSRRSQKASMTWARMRKLVEDWLPAARILHPWPMDRFHVTHPRSEPGA